MFISGVFISNLIYDNFMWQVLVDMGQQPISADS